MGQADANGDVVHHDTPLDAGNHNATLLGDWPLFRLHGNVPQRERMAAYRSFHAAKSGLLVCTDVAARGLDLPSVDWIIQYVRAVPPPLKIVK